MWAPVFEPEDDDDEDDEEEEDELAEERTDGDGEVLNSWGVDWLPFTWQVMLLFTFTDRLLWLLLLPLLLLALDFLDGLHTKFNGW